MSSFDERDFNSLLISGKPACNIGKVFYGMQVGPFDPFRIESPENRCNLPLIPSLLHGAAVIHASSGTEEAADDKGSAEEDGRPSAFTEVQDPGTREKDAHRPSQDAAEPENGIV
jgi:hypothetical protein